MKLSSALRLGISTVSILAFSPPPVSAAEEIKIASTGAGLSTLPLEVAARKGFFRDEGFDVLTITMRANIAVNALLTQGVDYATPSTSTIKAATAGLPVKTIAVLLGRPDYFLTVKKDVKSLRDLKGKRIAIGSYGAAADLALRAVAKQDGLDPERDLVRLQMGGAAARYAALASGSVDATILTLPYNLQAERAGYKDLLWFGERMELPLAGLAVRDETIKKNPKQVYGIIRAVFRAMAFAGANREETIQMLTNWLKLDRDVAARSYELGKRSWSDGGVVSDAAVQTLVDQSLLELKAKDPVPLDKVRNWSFAEQARRELVNSAGGR
ncbi:MAG TPA: ABC transporter substrate-binding protein [Candidatus Binatia bacterium]|nr:ABC transporter substrate-binding protein [Candidatus Binatia bacterium]